MNTYLQFQRAVGLLLALIAILALPGCGTYVEDERLSFKLTDLDDNPVTLDDKVFRGKVVLVDIWGTWCPPCIEQLPHLIALYDTYHDQGLEIVGIDFDAYLLGTEEKRQAAMKEFVAESGINYRVLLGGDTTDVEGVFPTLRRFKGFPTSIFIGRDGRVRHVEVGFIGGTAANHEKIVKELLAETATPAKYPVFFPGRFQRFRH